jgi:hypothetical protein
MQNSDSTVSGTDGVVSIAVKGIVNLAQIDNKEVAYPSIPIQFQDFKSPRLYGRSPPRWCRKHVLGGR